MTTPAKHDIERPSLWARFKASPLWDPATRAAHSGWQAAAAVWLVAIPAVGLASAPWLAGVIAGGTAAVGSVLASVVTWKVPEQKTRVNDLLRYVRTFGVALAGTWTAAGVTVAVFDWRAALLAAALATVGSVVKTGVVNGNGLARELLDEQRNARLDPNTFVAAVDRAVENPQTPTTYAQD